MHHRVTRIEREIEELGAENREIKINIEAIRDKLIEHTPDHFSKQDILRATIGALFLSFSVLFSGNILNISLKVPSTHIYIILFATLFLLTAEIYLIGYSRVKDKQARKFGQFWIKRLITFYSVSLVVSFALTFVFGMMYLVSSLQEYLRLIIVISSPCAIGAALSDLLKKY